MSVPCAREHTPCAQVCWDIFFASSQSSQWEGGPGQGGPPASHFPRLSALVGSGDLGGSVVPENGNHATRGLLCLLLLCLLLLCLPASLPACQLNA